MRGDTHSSSTSRGAYDSSWDASVSDRMPEEANEAYSQLLSSELFGSDYLGAFSPTSHGIYASMSPSRGNAYISQTSSPSRHRTLRTDSLGPVSPKKNLLNFRSPKSGASTPHRLRDYRLSASPLTSGRLHEATAWDGDQSPYGPLASSQLDSPALSPSSSTSGLFSPREQVDSPVHTAFSTSPVKPESQHLLLGARKSTRTISKVPYKVLDAPELADDFYLNLVDWSVQDMLSVGLGKCVYLWSAKSASVTKLCDLQGIQDSITGLSWSNHGQFLAVGSQSGLVQIWDVETQKLLRTMMGHSARVGALAWNNYILTTGSRDRTIYHRDARVPEHHIKTLLSHRQEVCGLRWNPAQNQLASGGNDNKLLVWDRLDETPLHKFTEHTAAVKAIAWSPHQQGLLASGGGTADMKIRFWNTQTGSPLSVIDTGSQVCNLAWNKMCNEIVSTHGYSSGQIHNQIQVWRYPSLSQVATLTGHTMRVLYLAMSPSGKSIVTGAGDETLRFWDLNTPTRDTLDRVDDHGLQASFTKLR
ncbi:substrate-specific activator of APC-dependent proteolysis [Malassezia nana]|uniref:Substrate-specific activator of APC-dependent proteolysis n=1 Tax=Malassezia nana TaxID=180528 RepID=A0AAF0J2N1_9BASI|nr:substrate-specific activator of APC-dependent proteolysis [Malassezia nana]